MISSAVTTFELFTSAEMACPPSFTPLEIAIWECSSIIPAVKCFPFESMIIALVGVAVELVETDLILWH